MGGENDFDIERLAAVLGSSPRGRGKLFDYDAHTDAYGLIPAWAGKTSLHQPQVRVQTAHPRVGGENQIIQLDEDTLPGSSPRGRGKL